MNNITLIPVLQDNYSYLIEADGMTAIVDPGEPGPIESVLDARNLSPSLVLNTHHHGDHTAGNIRLKEKYGAQVVGPEADRNRIPGMDTGVREGGKIPFGTGEIQVLETPGHTSGHVCFYWPEAQALFCGDTLFSMGCGRLFEGTAAQLRESLHKIMMLEDDTRIYCGHEYTLANGAFCLSVEPDNEDIKARMQEVRTMRDKGLPSIPSSLELEKKTNVFLRTDNAGLFAEYRRKKDTF